MKKTLFILSLSLFSGLSAMELSIKLPSADVIAERLKNADLGHFAQKTNFHSLVADKEMEPLQLSILIDGALYSYYKKARQQYQHTTDSMTEHQKDQKAQQLAYITTQETKNKSTILHLLLDQSVIAELKSKGFLENIEPTVTFPESHVISIQLATAKIPAHVSQKLNIPDTFAEKTMAPAQINNTINSLFTNYLDNIEDLQRKEKARQHLAKEREMLVCALLLHHPEMKQAVLQATNKQ